MQIVAATVTIMMVTSGAMIADIMIVRVKVGVISARIRESSRCSPLVIAIDIMQTRSLKDIGILECEVDLSGKPEYKRAESEFRVTPDKIKSVKRIL